MTLGESQTALLKALGLEEFNGLDDNWISKVQVIIEAGELTRVLVNYTPGPKAQKEFCKVSEEFTLKPKEDE